MDKWREVFHSPPIADAMAVHASMNKTPKQQRGQARVKQPERTQVEMQLLSLEVVSLIGGDVPKLYDLDFPHYVAKPPVTGK
jgi:hypothetical protein